MRTWPAIDVGRLTAPDLLQAALTDYDVLAIDERSPDSWLVFFSTAPERDSAAASLAADFPDLSFASIDVPDEDWAARSQAALRAIRIGNIVVAPPWDVPADDGSPPPVTISGVRFRKPTVVIIQPSMGFGTGHHATTRLCLAALQQFDVRGGTVIDVGTGSGVLAIAASRLGAARVIAIDDDPDAVQSARDNAARNGVAVDLRVADLRDTGPLSLRPGPGEPHRDADCAVGRSAAGSHDLTRSDDSQRLHEARGAERDRRVSKASGARSQPGRRVGLRHTTA